MRSRQWRPHDEINYDEINYDEINIPIKGGRDESYACTKEKSYELTARKKALCQNVTIQAR